MPGDFAQQELGLLGVQRVEGLVQGSTVEESSRSTNWAPPGTGDTGIKVTRCGSPLSWCSDSADLPPGSFSSSISSKPPLLCLTHHPGSFQRPEDVIHLLPPFTFARSCHPRMLFLVGQSLPNPTTPTITCASLQSLTQIAHSPAQAANPRGSAPSSSFLLLSLPTLLTSLTLHPG